MTNVYINFRNEQNIDLPDAGSYGTGIFFMGDNADSDKQQFEALAAECSIKVCIVHEVFI